MRIQLVVDVPGELNLQTMESQTLNINTGFIISPTTKDDRVESIAKNSTGFIITSLSEVLQAHLI